MDKVLERLDGLDGVSTGRGNPTVLPSGIMTLSGLSMNKNKGTGSLVVVGSGPGWSGPCDGTQGDTDGNGIVFGSPF